MAVERSSFCTADSLFQNTDDLDPLRVAISQINDQMKQVNARDNTDLVGNLKGNLIVKSTETHNLTCFSARSTQQEILWALQNTEGALALKT